MRHLLLLVATCLLARAASGSVTQSRGAQRAASPVGSSGDSVPEVAVGVYVLNVGRIDTTNGVFEADMYLYLTASHSRYELTGETESYFPNAGSNPRVWQVSKLKSSSNLTSQYRIKSQFYFTPDARPYPFDEFDFPIVFEDPHSELRELQLAVDGHFSALSRDIRMPGFSRAAEATFRAEVSNVTYPGGKRFARYTGVVHITRPRLNAAIKAFLPGCMILFVVALNSSIPRKHATARAGVAGSSLVALVLFHSNLISAVPSTGQLTLADSFMAIGYILISLAFAVCLLLLRLAEAGAGDAADELHYAAQLAQWYCTPLSVAAVAVADLGGALAVLFTVLAAVAGWRYVALRRAESALLSNTAWWWNKPRASRAASAEVALVSTGYEADADAGGGDVGVRGRGAAYRRVSGPFSDDEL